MTSSPGPPAARDGTGPGGRTGIAWLAAGIAALASYALLSGTTVMALCRAPRDAQVDTLVQVAVLLLLGLVLSSLGAARRARRGRGGPSDRTVQLALRLGVVLLVGALVVVSLITLTAMAFDDPNGRGALAAAAGFSAPITPPVVLVLVALATRRVRPGVTSPRKAALGVAAVQLVVYAVGVVAYLGSEPWRCG
jgi:hypothetical protein